MGFRPLGNHLMRVARSPDHISVQPLPRRPFLLLALLPPSFFSLMIARTMRPCPPPLQ